ncbi:MAG: type ii site-specific deoxyribonuclease [Chloroflexi bacterium]|nr:MAG: type ii site-specific deoxyribonuclease [Chloroflexota bacterium]
MAFARFLINFSLTFSLNSPILQFTGETPRETSMSEQNSSTQPTPPEVVALVERFTGQRTAYRAGKYNETQLRRDFLDPLFEALGWDMTNRKNYSERYREVIHEVSVEVEGLAKAADYAFQSGGSIHFFVEAKKPAVNIETNPEPSFQIRRYAWSAKLPVSIVTDFEQMAVYDCRAKPVLGDPVHLGRANLYSYLDYVDKWDEIYNLFSYQAVHQGALDQFVVSLKGKRGTADVDDAFLVEMERWREELARNLALRNPSLTQRDINFSVQTTIDRIIFLRICEERGIEAENALRDATDGKDVYGDLLVLFKHADKKYNSGLFHFDAEKGQSSFPDTLTPTLKIDDKVLKDILANLYYPKSPYAFKYISADILGQVYERFLGKVIRLTAGHQAKVEEKPEVRKAGGVYYTPTYIVEYIVKNTVGELLKGKDPESLQASPVRALDPACGSGSFLLGAYQYLLDWHLDWYVQNDPAKWAKGKTPPIFEIRNGWQLTMQKKKDILTRHIFGVDIDAQAVEVTKLSLLLKVVENPGQLSLLGERILPDLGENIKCGNSLIGPDYYDNQQLTMFDSEEQYRVNAFDWQKSFPKAFAKGGFDAVIGNPPYIRIQALKEWAPTEVEFYKKKYKAASKGNYDIYVVFVEKGLSLLNQSGRLGFILPHKFFNAQYGEPIRSLISSGKHLSKIVHFGDQQVFEGATTYICLMFLQKFGNLSLSFERVDNLSKWISGVMGQTATISLEKISSAEWNFTVGENSALFDKLEKMPTKLGDISEKIYQGPITSADKIYLFKSFRNNNNLTTEVFSEELNEWVQIETDLLKTVIRSGSIKRYLANPTALVLYPYEVENSEARLLTLSEIQSKYPLAWNYFNKNKKALENREKGKFKSDGWYKFGRTQNLGFWEQPKIMIPYMITELSAYCDLSDHFYFINVTTGGYGLVLKSTGNSLQYICGLLNSKLLDFYFKIVTTTFNSGYFAANKQYVEKLPIRTINFSDPADVARHDRMVALVQSMLTLHKQSAAARLPDEKERITRQIQTTDRQIDKLVYQLYNLTPAEIAIVEGSS